MRQTASIALIGVFLLVGFNSAVQARKHSAQQQDTQQQDTTQTSGEVDAWVRSGIAEYQKGNHTGAVRWWLKAAGQGSPDAQTMLGVAYYSGAGVQQSYSEAVKWYEKAVIKGHPLAQLNLGLMCIAGQGVGVDYARAAKLVSSAAETGDQQAQFNLGSMYAQGKGVPQDFVLAYMWSALSATQGNANAAQNRDYIAAKLTSAQRAKAQKLAADWRAKPRYWR